jgi:cyclic pyranopterin phosphate synthase
MIQLKDAYKRKHDYLRISLTDRCNLNCIYCNPNSKLTLSEKSDLLTFEEIERTVDIFTSLGVNKIRLTGGEPLARKNITGLFVRLNEIKKRKPFELAITTNGLLLEDKIEELQDSGLDRVNISLDSLNLHTFARITGSDELITVLKSINKAVQLGIKVKLNTVVIKGINDSELLEFCKFSIDNGINVRFIEFMPFSNNGWNNEKFIRTDEMLELIRSKYKLEKLPITNSPAIDYQISGTKGKISFINSISDHFCSNCNRLRLTSIGMLKLCLFSSHEKMLNLKKLISENNENDSIAAIISDYLQLKDYEHPSLENLIAMNNNNMIQIGG